MVAKIKAYHKLLSTFATNGKLELALLVSVQVRGGGAGQGMFWHCRLLVSVKGWAARSSGQGRALRCRCHAWPFEAIIHPPLALAEMPKYLPYPIPVRCTAMRTTACSRSSVTSCACCTTPRSSERIRCCTGEERGEAENGDECCTGKGQGRGKGRRGGARVEASKGGPCRGEGMGGGGWRIKSRG